jgi:hypothetical protein
VHQLVKEASVCLLEARGGIVESKCILWEDVLFSDVDVKLVRRLWKSKGCGERKWMTIFRGYSDALGSGRQLFDYAVSLFPKCGEREFIDFLKEFSRVCLRELLSCKALWLLPFLDLKVLGGFDTVYNRDEPFASYKKDYGVKSKQILSKRLRYWIRDTVNKLEIKRVGYSFEDYISFRDAWAVGGSSVQGTAKYVGGSDTRRGIRVKDKWYALSHLEDREIVERCLSEEETIVKPFVKIDEPAACRTVQSYDTFSIIRCSFLDEALGNRNHGGSWTTLGAGLQEKAELRKSIKGTIGTRVCTDQSSFDTHQSKSWVVFALRVLFDRIIAVNPHMKVVAEAEFRSLSNVYLEYEGSRLRWENGVLSGYKFTADIDTILNRAESRCAFEALGCKIKFERYHGDDALVILDGTFDKERLVKEYSKMGLDLHPQKTWVGKQWTEYLHEIYAGNRVCGFPARAFRAIAWQKPITGSGEVFGAAKFNALVSVLRMGARRGLDVVDMLRRVVKIKCPSFNEESFQGWLSTPVVLGGAGFRSTGRVALKVETTNRMRESTLRIDGGVLPRLLSAARARAEGKVPIHGMRYSVRFERVRGSKEMDPLKATKYLAVQPPRTDWQVQDLVKFTDAYERKLNLEDKLRGGDVIKPSDLPESWRWREDCDRLYRRYRRLVSETFGYDNVITTVETFWRLTDWVNRVWAGICYRVPDPGKVDKELRLLALRYFSASLNKRIVTVSV